MSSRPLSEVFIPEAEELLDQMEVDLEELGGGEPRPESIADRLNSLFRSAHSLKGMAGMAGLAEIAQLSHDLEDFMDRLRMGQLAVDAAILDLVGDGVSLLRKLVSVIMPNAEGSTAASFADEVTQFVTQLRQATTKKPTEEGPSLEALGIPATLVASLTTYEEHRLRENIRMGRSLYAVKTRFSLDGFDRQLGQLSACLQELGEVVTTVPQVSSSDNVGEIWFDLILGSERPLAEISDQVSELAHDIVLLCQPSREPAGGPAAPLGPARQPVPVREAVSSIRSLGETVRVDISHLDDLLNVMGELVLQKAVLYQLSKELLERDGSAGLAGDLLKAVQTVEHRLTEMQEGLVEARMVPLGQMFDRLVRATRKLSKDLDKQVDLRMSGEETRLDKTMIEAIADPLLHLLRNSMDHGIESHEQRKAAGKPEAGQITLRARAQGNSVTIDLVDDGRGIDLARVREVAIERGLADPTKQYEDAALINMMFQPGFSTASEVSEVSGRGVGLDVVAKNIATLGGLVDVSTTKGVGTTFSITLPLTLVIIRSLVVHVGVELYAVPLASVTETLMIHPSQILTVEGAEVMELRERTLPLLRLQDHFACARGAGHPEELYVVVVGVAETRLGLLVDGIEGQQEIVIKSMGELLKGLIPGIAGAAELGNRQMILVLDIPALLDEAAQLASPVR